MENSSIIQSGIAPPHGLAVEGLRSKRKVSTPPAANASAAEEPAGPPPITAARSLRPEMEVAVMVRLWGFGFWWGFRVLRGGVGAKRRLCVSVNAAMVLGGSVMGVRRVKEE